MMNDMKVGDVIVLLPEHKEQSVSEFNELGQVVIVGECGHLKSKLHLNTPIHRSHTHTNTILPVGGGHEFRRSVGSVAGCMSHKKKKKKKEEEKKTRAQTQRDKVKVNCCSNNVHFIGP